MSDREQHTQEVRALIAAYSQIQQARLHFNDLDELGYGRRVSDDPKVSNTVLGYAHTTTGYHKAKQARRRLERRIAAVIATFEKGCTEIRVRTERTFAEGLIDHDAPLRHPELMATKAEVREQINNKRQLREERQLAGDMDAVPLVHQPEP